MFAAPANIHYDSSRHALVVPDLFFNDIVNVPITPAQILVSSDDINSSGSEPEAESPDSIPEGAEPTKEESPSQAPAPTPEPQSDSSSFILIGGVLPTLVASLAACLL